MNQKGFAVIYVLVGILVLAAVTGGAYFFTRSQISSSIPKQSPSPSSLLPMVTENNEKLTPELQKQIPSLDETASWKTYTKLGYAIKYPQSSVITEYDLDSSMPDLLSSTSTEVKIEGRQSPVLFLVYVWKNMGVNITDSASREEWCSLLEKELTGQLQCRHQKSLPMVEVNGYVAYQSTGGRDSTYIKTIYIPHNNYVYELTIPIGEDAENKFPISDQILSTFKFLDQNQTEKTQISEMQAVEIAKKAVQETNIKKTRVLVVDNVKYGKVWEVDLFLYESNIKLSGKTVLVDMESGRAVEISDFSIVP